ncbi:MAG: DeoR/GlpR family DNA-binding transcription regulator [Planctomycetia bacterium]|nr:DeoR/GlpR family DNA-binding transcription regulator [Planctomycetia bacterium]
MNTTTYGVDPVMAARNDRQEAIHNLLAERGRLNVEELAETLNVTTMTIRRDLSAMESEGVLTRVHGGCVLQSPFVHELPFSEKDQQRPAEKNAIARAAVRYLRRADRVYLDTGTTAVHLARILPGDLELGVFTNNLRVALELFGRKGVEVAVYGGALGQRSPDLTGEVALSRIRDFRIDVAIMGADALDARRGEFYSADSGTAMLSRAAQRQAERTLVLVDSSKFGKHSLAVIGRLTDGVTLVTDAGISDADRALIESTGAEVVVASIP